MEFAAVDIGASGTRVMSSSGRTALIPNNAVMLSENDDVKMSPYDDTLEQALYIKIRKLSASKVFPKCALLGVMAERKSISNIRPSVQQQKYLQDLNYISAITAAAVSRIELVAEETMKLYIAVPPAEVHKAQEAFKEELMGQFEVEFPKYNGGTTVKLNITDVECAEECVMSMVSFMFTQAGTVSDAAKQYMTGNVLGINIGASTADLCVVKNGRYIEKSGRTIPVGGNIARDYLIERINDEYGFELPFTEAETAMAEARMSLGNSKVDIPNIVSEAKSQLAEEITNRMDPYFKSIGVPIQTLKGVVVSGGGSLRSSYKEGPVTKCTSEPISSFITEKLKKWCKEVSVVEYGDDARMADVRGLYIKAKMDASCEETVKKENFQI